MAPIHPRSSLPWRALLGLGIIGPALLLGQGAAAQTPTDPESLPLGPAGDVLAIAVLAPGAPSLSIGGQSVPLRDDGQGADAAAGDGVWSASLREWPHKTTQVVLSLDGAVAFDDQVAFAPVEPRLLAVMEPGQPASLRFLGELPDLGAAPPPPPTAPPSWMWIGLATLGGTAGGLWLGLSLKESPWPA